MAVIATPLNSTLRIVFQTGLDEENKPILKTKSFNRVKTSALDEDLMDVAKDLSALQIHQVNSVRRVLETELAEEEP
jgi:hypothetical protein